MESVYRIVPKDLGLLIGGYVPSRGDQQTIVSHYPNVLELQSAGMVVTQLADAGLLCMYVVGKGGLQPLRFVPVDGVVDDELGVFGGSRLRRDGRHRTPGYSLSLSSGEARFGCRHCG